MNIEELVRIKARKYKSSHVASKLPVVGWMRGEDDHCKTYDKLNTAFIVGDLDSQRTNFDVIDRSTGGLKVADDNDVAKAITATEVVRIQACVSDIGLDSSSYLCLICWEVDDFGIGLNNKTIMTSRLSNSDIFALYPESVTNQFNRSDIWSHEWDSILCRPENHSIQFFSKEESDKLIENFKLSVALEAL